MVVRATIQLLLQETTTAIRPPDLIRLQQVAAVVATMAVETAAAGVHRLAAEEDKTNNNHNTYVSGNPLDIGVFFKKNYEKAIIFYHCGVSYYFTTSSRYQ
jgi:hypothetical protein